MNENPPSTNSFILKLDPIWLEKILDLPPSSDYPETMPLANLVGSTLIAVARHNPHKASLYRMAIGLFLCFLSLQLEDELPEDINPLAICAIINKQTFWFFSGPAGVLRCVSPCTLDGFMAWRSSQGDSKADRRLRKRAVYTFLRVAYRDGILTSSQAYDLGIAPYRIQRLLGA